MFFKCKLYLSIISISMFKTVISNDGHCKLEHFYLKLIVNLVIFIILMWLFQPITPDLIHLY